jgi:hypothetical protein
MTDTLTENPKPIAIATGWYAIALLLAQIAQSSAPPKGWYKWTR